MRINALELKAILFALQAFSRELCGTHVKVFCDNTTAVTCVNVMGGTKSPIGNSLSSLIWDWCVLNQAWVTCSHIPGRETLLVDSASRASNDRHEWKRNERIFHVLYISLVLLPLNCLLTDVISKLLPFVHGNLIQKQYFLMHSLCIGHSLICITFSLHFS